MRLRRGFTLVELLIVMIIIAVMAGMLLLASSEAASTANVRKVLSDLQLMKTAILACCMDNPDKYPNIPDCDQPSMAEVRRYLSNKSIIDDNGKDNSVGGGSFWKIEVQKSGKQGPIWYLRYKLPEHMTDDYSFREKLAAKAKAQKLFVSMEPNPDEVFTRPDSSRWLYNAEKGNGNSDPVNFYTPIAR